MGDHRAGGETDHHRLDVGIVDVGGLAVLGQLDLAVVAGVAVEFLVLNVAGHFPAVGEQARQVQRIVVVPARATVDLRAEVPVRAQRVDIDRVGTIAAAQNVVVTAAVDLVVSGAAVYFVGSVARIDRVVAGIAVQRVGAVIAIDQVIARAAVDGIVARLVRDDDLVLDQVAVEGIARRACRARSR